MAPRSPQKLPGTLRRCQELAEPSRTTQQKLPRGARRTQLRGARRTQPDRTQWDLRGTQEEDPG